MNFLPSGHGTGYPGDGFNNGGPSSRGRGGREEFTQPTSLPITPYTSDSYPFFLPGEGISRQVIQTDLPRYLGNNSHCKPGHDEFVRPLVAYSAVAVDKLIPSTGTVRLLV